MNSIELTPKDFIKHFKCPNCGSSKTSNWYRFAGNLISQRTFPNGLGIFTNELRDQRKLLECNKCGLVYQFIIPSKELLKDLYSSSEEYKPWPPDTRRLTWKRAILEIENKGGRILDIGANDGHFLSLVPNTFSKYALEPTAANNDLLTERVEKVYTGFIDDYIEIEDNKFDVVTMFDVAEHLSDIPKAFSNVNNIMKKGGILVIESGDSGCLTATLFKSLWWYTDYIEHFVFFNRRSLNYALKEAGFEIIKYERVVHTDFTKEYSIRESYKTNLIKLFKWLVKGKLKKISIRKEAFIHHPFRVFCKDHFFIVARKK